MIKKFYADLDYGQTHFRRAGAGKPVVVLHASPMSSALMVPLMNVLAEHSDVIAPDTPGYGQSDPLPEARLEAAEDLTPYVEWLNSFLDSLELTTIRLYGSATGAQIAIEFARAYPERVDCLVLDNAAHFEPAERAEITQYYFPGITPEADGSHLQDVWKMAYGVFKWFPWYAQDKDHQVSEAEPPAEAVHATALAYLAAGQDYAQAYKRAFKNEDASRVQSITVPVKVIRWSGSVIREYADRFDQFEWPSNIEMCHVDGDMQNRYLAVSNIIKESA